MKAKVIDLEEIFKSWAWDHYQNTNTGIFSRLFNRKLKYKNAVVMLNWEHVKMTPLEPLYEEKDDDKSAIKVVFESEYENATEQDQTHSFKTERDTVSTATFSLTKGYSRSSNVGLEVNLPQDMVNAEDKQNVDDAKKRQMATASFGNSIHLDTEEGNTVEKALNWGVDTTITSRSDKTTIAKLQVEETTSSYSFTLKVMVKGRIVAVIKDARGEGKLIQTVEGDVATVLSDRKRGQGLQFDKDRRAFLPIQGTVIFKYGVSQKVKVAYANRGDVVQRLYPHVNGFQY